MRRLVALLVVLCMFVAGCGSSQAKAPQSQPSAMRPSVCKLWYRIDIKVNTARAAAIVFQAHSDVQTIAQASRYRVVIKFKLLGQTTDNGVGVVTQDGQVMASFFTGPPKPDANGYVTLDVGIGSKTETILGVAKTIHGMVAIKIAQVAMYTMGDQPATTTYSQTPTL